MLRFVKLSGSQSMDQFSQLLGNIGQGGFG